MTTKHQQEAWLRQIKQTLDESADNLDAATLSKLNQARQHALQQNQRYRSFLLTNTWLTGALGSAATAALAFVVWSYWPVAMTPPQPEQLAFEDLDIVTAQADFEFYQELDFYDWLATEHDAG